MALLFTTYTRREKHHLEVTPFRRTVYLLPDKMVCYTFRGDRLDFSVGDFQWKHSIRFTAERDVNSPFRVPSLLSHRLGR